PDLKVLVGQIIGLINYIIPVGITLSLVHFFWGIVPYLYDTSDPHAKEADKKIFVWGLLALFVMTSVWGIVAMLCLNFFGNRSCVANTNTNVSGSYYGI
ncbi:MAG: hypothetical protein AAB964_02110, partial [Patescibacteria group bacterium]